MRWNIAQRFEIRWWQKYLKDKDVAAYAAWKTDYWRQFLSTIEVLPRPGSTAIDVGCGPAGIFTVLDQQQVTALDPLLAQYQQKLPHFDPAQYPWVDFVAQPLEAYDTPTRYETLFCINAINHVKDIAHCFDKLVALTEPGGTMVVSIDAHNYKLPKYVFRLVQNDVLHPHQYDLSEYSDMLTDRGCTIERTILYKPEWLFNYYVIVCKAPR